MELVAKSTSNKSLPRFDTAWKEPKRACRAVANSEGVGQDLLEWDQLAPTQGWALMELHWSRGYRAGRRNVSVTVAQWQLIAGDTSWQAWTWSSGAKFRNAHGIYCSKVTWIGNSNKSSNIGLDLARISSQLQKSKSCLCSLGLAWESSWDTCKNGAGWQHANQVANGPRRLLV